MLDEAQPVAEVHGELVSAAIVLRPNASLRATFSHLDWWSEAASCCLLRVSGLLQKPWGLRGLDVHVLRETYILVKDANRLLSSEACNRDHNLKKLLSDLNGLLTLLSQVIRVERADN
jgi:hypothetical protein